MPRHLSRFVDVDFDAADSAPRAAPRCLRLLRRHFRCRYVCVKRACQRVMWRYQRGGSDALKRGSKSRYGERRARARRRYAARACRHTRLRARQRMPPAARARAVMRHAAARKGAMFVAMRGARARYERDDMFARARRRVLVDSRVYEMITLRHYFHAELPRLTRRVMRARRGSVVTLRYVLHARADAFTLSPADVVADIDVAAVFIVATIVDDFLPLDDAITPVDAAI